MHLINEKIKTSKVLLVTDSGKEDLDISSALSKADSFGLDLVSLSESDGVSVCKLMDYSKYLFEQKKSKKSVKCPSLKEIKLGCNIAEHDLRISANKASHILNAGDKVRVIVIFKGRQKSLVHSLGKPLIDKFLSFLSPDNILVVQPPKLEGNSYIALIEKKQK